MRSLPLLLALTLIGCQSSAQQTAAPPPAPKKVTLAAGTPVKLVLFDELTSGGSEKGAEVRLALAEPLSGLPILCPASAIVSQSRTEGTLGALLNQPARLAIQIKSLKTPAGEEIPLAVDTKGETEYELNRANTGRPEPPEGDVPDEALQMSIRELVQKGQTQGLDAKQVAELAKRLQLAETAKLAETDKLNEVQGLIQAVRSGTNLATLVTGGAAGAAMELVRVAGDTCARVGKKLGGRNIRAYPGTTVTAYVAKDTSVTVP
ncbi:hypothetical protein EON82_13910 [bacterium]|nr:MAG: hypothetical protein EON82_13910 [bacterium]